MKYLKVNWKHTFPKEPLELFMEIDDADMETRKVHVYPDGHRERADTNLPDQDTELSYVPMPPLDEINADPEFEGCWITREEFEKEWNKTPPQQGHDA
ncbi:DUF6881 domain-containing protein [Neorhizobium tomejilense]|uniref:DUF6881 domain-containing protein n=1 Tax=Neorhizobium tomejilense TaxID=2093828 RepID=UPI000CF9F441|nr:hypothetical protein [Neorhizobium tomejilense]